MTSKRKLLMRVRNNPRDVRFTDLITLVEWFGFVLERHEGTSHRIYRHSQARVKLNLQPAKHGKAKEYQVRQFFDAVDAFGLDVTSEDESS